MDARHDLRASHREAAINQGDLPQMWPRHHSADQSGRLHQYPPQDVQRAKVNESDVKLSRRDLPPEVIRQISEVWTAKVLKEADVEFGVCLRGCAKDAQGRCLDTVHSQCWPLPPGAFVD